MDLVDYARQFVGFQETTGSNRGPLVDKWKREVSAPLETKPIPWCGVFAFAMLRESMGFDRKQLATAIGFDPKTWFPESADSWLIEARKCARITGAPLRGDIFLLMVPKITGGYSLTDAHHVGICAEDVGLVSGRAFATVEGNTVPGTVEGKSSREGTSVAARSRIYRPGAFVFLSLPKAVKTAAAVQKQQNATDSAATVTTKPKEFKA